MQDLTNFSIQIAVFFIMWVVGLDLVPGDFRRVVRHPKAAVVGTIGQLLCPPVVAAVLVLVLNPPPAAVAGLILIAASPSGSISNLLTLLIRGNVALSVSLTAVSNVVGVLTFPLLAAMGFVLLLGEAAEVAVPVKAMMQQLALLMVLPLGLGMFVRFRSEAVHRHRVMFQRLSFLLVLVVTTMLAIDQRAAIVDALRSAAGLSAMLTIVLMAAGLAAGRLARLRFADSKALLMEFSARNIAIALVVAVTTMGRRDFAAIIIAYFVVQMLVTILVIGLIRWVGAGAKYSR